MAILMYWHCNLLASANDLMAHFNSFFFFLFFSFSFSFFSLYGLDKGNFPAPPLPPSREGSPSVIPCEGILGWVSRGWGLSVFGDYSRVEWRLYPALDE